MPARLKWTRVERGVYHLTYLDDPAKDGGFWGRYKAFGQNKWTGPHASLNKARTALRKKLEEYDAQKQRGCSVLPSRETVAQLIAEYLKEQAGTVGEYRAQARYARFWTHYFQKRPILSLEPKDVRQARAKLKARKVKGAPLSDATVNHYLKFLRTMMTRLVKPKAWVIEFWSDIPIKAAVPKRVRGTYTEEQEERLYKALRDFDVLFCRLAFLLGLRGGQLAQLRWEYVAWTVSLLALPKFKNHPPREIPLELEARTILLHVWEQQGRPESGWIFPAVSGNQFILKPHKRGMPMDYHNWYNRYFRKALIEAKLDGLGLDFHTLRHTWASQMGERVPSRVLQVLGGWSDLKLVERYSKPGMAAARQAMAEVSRFGSEGAKGVLTRILKNSPKHLQVVEKK